MMSRFLTVAWHLDLLAMSTLPLVINVHHYITAGQWLDDTALSQCCQDHNNYSMVPVVCMDSD